MKSTTTWEEYKPLVANSRKVIIFPFLTNSLRGESGNCLDVGCGTGDLTCYLADTLHLNMTGIDKEIPLSTYALTSSSTHFVNADILKNGILETGIQFDCAFSNCCFCHLSDNGFIVVLADLYKTLKINAPLTFLVPSIEWAKKMYSDIEYVPSGITAKPRYGDRQYFRTPAWYISWLQRSGFSNVKYEQVLIPNDKQLEARYLDNIGMPLFTAFTAVRGEEIPNQEEITKAFDIAHENRKLEIQLFWQRSLFFWGFVAAALIGYVGALKENAHLTIVFALFGLVCSIVWSQGNRGSKYWQEYWEKKVNFYQHHSTGNIFYDRKPTIPRLWEMFEGRRISVSKLTMALSDFTVFLWCVLALNSLVDARIESEYYQPIGVVLALATLCYCLFFLRMAKSED